MGEVQTRCFAQSFYDPDALLEISVASLLIDKIVFRLFFDDKNSHQTSQ